MATWGVSCQLRGNRYRSDRVRKGRCWRVEGIAQDDLIRSRWRSAARRFTSPIPRWAVSRAVLIPTAVLVQVILACRTQAAVREVLQIPI
jgi:hypothetical protein